MTTYEIREGLKGDILIKIDEDGTESFVPMDEANADYQRYLNPDLENGTISQEYGKTLQSRPAAT